ncbi:MAG TPA: TetR/AcrR family transcriptional regulator [Firmicutes bacterium]|nr:TetR/AcrR family transcriptional regulator [Bacillota bacterium]
MPASSADELSQKHIAILNAAEKVFAEVGFHKAKVEEIAEVANVAKGTVYLYFKSKKDILQALMKDRMSRLIPMIEKELEKTARIRSKIHSIIQVHFQFYQEQKEFITILYGQLGQIAEGMEGPAKQGLENLERMITGLFKQGMESGVLRRTDARALAQAFIAMINAVAFNWVIDSNDSSPDKLIDFVYQLFAQGAMEKTAGAGEML